MRMRCGTTGIDLNDDGVTLNDAGDADTGPNFRQNFPELDVIYSAAGAASVNAVIRTTPNTPQLVEFFA